MLGALTVHLSCDPAKLSVFRGRGDAMKTAEVIKPIIREVLSIAGGFVGEGQAAVNGAPTLDKLFVA